MLRLTPHFTLDELIRSDQARLRGIDNIPTTEHIGNIRQLALGLEMVRLILGAPIIITSAYRCPELNALVGGTPTSAHALGFAADFHCDGVPPFKSAFALVNLLPYDQLIYEPGRCVHISFDPRLRGEVWTQPGGPGTKLVLGIHP